MLNEAKLHYNTLSIESKHFLSEQPGQVFPLIDSSASSRYYIDRLIACVAFRELLIRF